ncbi:hypothetical protein TRVA0_025S01200 [Trichomonascus vanleenenianus]|uniref:uncharacterized protein n=1 Tax=Trichomonascus vanleenenianus TaxID=2268995 RepID=UPI003ECA0CD9
MGRVRAALTLSVILLAAFVLQLLTVISVPVTRSITLCEYNGYQFGVFGYCNIQTNKCSGVGVGYDVHPSSDQFTLPSNARNSLANLLIVHVIAAGLTLILLLLTALTLFRAPGSSSRYLLIVLFFAIPTFLVSLLAFLVDILLFTPHLAWGGWIMLAATILLGFFGISLCVVRRTLSSRKAFNRQRNTAAEPKEVSSGDMNDFSVASGSAAGPALPNPRDDYTMAPMEIHRGSQPSSELQFDGSYANVAPYVSRSRSNSITNYEHAATSAYRRPPSARRPVVAESIDDNSIKAPQSGVLVANSSSDEGEAALPNPMVIPAGDYVAELAERQSVNDTNYGPNVVPIPRLREDVEQERTLRQAAPNEATQAARDEAQQYPVEQRYDYQQQYPRHYDYDAYETHNVGYVHQDGQYDDAAHEDSRYNDVVHHQDGEYNDTVYNQYDDQQGMAVAAGEQAYQEHNSYTRSSSQEFHQVYERPRRQSQNNNQQYHHPPPQQTVPYNRPESQDFDYTQYAPPSARMAPHGPRPQPSARSSVSSQGRRGPYHHHQQPSAPESFYEELPPNQPYYNGRQSVSPVVSRESAYYGSQPRQPKRSEMIIENNPDFQFAAATQKKAPKRTPMPSQNQPPPPNHSNTSLATTSSSSTHHRRKKNQGMPAAFDTADGPYGKISRRQ